MPLDTSTAKHSDGSGSPVTSSLLTATTAAGTNGPELPFYKVCYAVGLYDHAMRGAVAECVADCYAVGLEAIRGSLRLSDNAAAQVVQEVHRAFAVTLANAPANDRLLRPGQTY
jgi:hypothetical protein